MHTVTQSCRWTIRNSQAFSQHPRVWRCLNAYSHLQVSTSNSPTQGHGKGEGTTSPSCQCGTPANYGLPPPVTVQPPPLIHKPTGLIPSTLNEGPRMDIDTFCVVYLLPNTVLQHFRDNAITGTYAFSHITNTDLARMGFKIGEVIDLKEMVRMWASLKGGFWFVLHSHSQRKPIVSYFLPLSCCHTALPCNYCYRLLCACLEITSMYLVCGPMLCMEVRGLLVCYVIYIYI